MILQVIISLNYILLSIIYIDPPTDSVNVSVNPVNNTTVLISWTYENEHCITYSINVTANGTLSNIITGIQNKSYTIPSLSIGTNYSFIIIPIDTIGREGPPSSLIQYIWNGKYYTHTLIVFLIVPAQVVNISWDQISNDSITIILWWNEV